MIKHNFTISEIFNSAWTKTKEHAWFLFRTFLALGVIAGISSFIPIFSSIVDFFIGIALIAVSLVIVRGGTPTLNDFTKSFKTAKIFWHYALATLLFILITVLGLIALVLPGIYLATRLQFYRFLIVDNQSMGPVEALKKSMEMTKGHFWKLLGFMVVIILFNILGALLLLVGLLITIPVSVLASTYLYERLLTPVHHEHVTHHTETVA